VLDDQAIEHRLCDALFLGRQGGDQSTQLKHSKPA
jgi:hypothetical protein